MQHITIVHSFYQYFIYKIQQQVFYMETTELNICIQ